MPEEIEGAAPGHRPVTETHPVDLCLSLSVQIHGIADALRTAAHHRRPGFRTRTLQQRQKNRRQRNPRPFITTNQVPLFNCFHTSWVRSLDRNFSPFSIICLDHSKNCQGRCFPQFDPLCINVSLTDKNFCKSIRPSKKQNKKKKKAAGAGAESEPPSLVPMNLNSKCGGCPCDH